MSGGIPETDRFADAYSGRAVCVTGGAGFIGGHLVEALIGAGASVCVIDDLSTSTIDHVASLVDRAPDRVRFVYASILDGAALQDAIDGCDTVFHLAAMGSVPLSIEQPGRCMEVNVQGTQVVLDAARRAGAGRVVYSASSRRARPARTSSISEWATRTSRRRLMWSRS